MKPIVLLLLSGGKDSHQALQRLLQDKWHVYGLCIDGIQGNEKIGAQTTADQFKIPLQIVNIPFFDEQTWNPFKLIRRDIAMGVTAIKKAKTVNATAIATGVKKSDVRNPKLWWLRFFLLFGRAVLWVFGLQLIFPVWD